MKKKFAFLNRGSNIDKKKLYQKIVQLPYSEYKQDFNDSFDKIIKNDLLNEDQIQYLNSKYEERSKWVKAYMKEFFCAGSCTTSRIEAKHRTYKRFLNSSTRLTELFVVFKDLEDQEIKKFKDEIKQISKKDEKNLNQCEAIKFFGQEYSNYALQKIKEELIESTNYSIKKRSNNTW